MTEAILINTIGPNITNILLVVGIVAVVGWANLNDGRVEWHSMVSELMRRWIGSKGLSLAKVDFEISDGL